MTPTGTLEALIFVGDSGDRILLCLSTYLCPPRFKLFAVILFARHSEFRVLSIFVKRTNENRGNRFEKGEDEIVSCDEGLGSLRISRFI